MFASSSLSFDSFQSPNVFSFFSFSYLSLLIWELLMSFPNYLEDFAQSAEQAAIFGARKEHYSSRLEIDTEALVKNLNLKSPRGGVRSSVEPAKYWEKPARCMSPSAAPLSSSRRWQLRNYPSSYPNNMN